MLTFSSFSAASFNCTESLLPFAAGEAVALAAGRRVAEFIGDEVRGVAAARALALRVTEEVEDTEEDAGRLEAGGLALGEELDIIAASAGVYRGQSRCVVR